MVRFPVINQAPKQLIASGADQRWQWVRLGERAMLPRGKMRSIPRDGSDQWWQCRDVEPVERWGYA